MLLQYTQVVHKAFNSCLETNNYGDISHMLEGESSTRNFRAGSVSDRIYTYPKIVGQCAKDGGLHEKAVSCVVALKLMDY